jgi:tripartite-type tricarboxylate transporter receptor subunit TctC
VNSLPELIAIARQRPGKIAYATAGVGTVQHLTAWIISRDAGIEMLHVPYANTGQALKDVQAGEVPVYFTFLGPIDAQLRDGRLKALAVASNQRLRAWPDIPTVVELGFKDAAANPWNGVLAPAGTPPQIVDRLYREFREDRGDARRARSLCADGNGSRWQHLPIGSARRSRRPCSAGDRS